jgi:peptide/nickel transport system permease protein
MIRMGRGWLHDFYLLTGGVLILVVLVCGLLAPLLSPNDPNAQDLLNTLLPPAWEAGGNDNYWLGTDGLGRCVLSQLLYGARIAAFVGIVVPISTALLGGALGVLSGFGGRRTDWWISRLVNLWMSFPPAVLALVLIISLSPSLWSVILAITLVDWTIFCRVVRSEVMLITRQDYIAAARIAGSSKLQIVWRDVLPGVLPVLITLFSIEIGVAVVTESVLSFVGVSADPQTPTWGAMIADGLSTVFQQPTGLVFPMLALIVTVLGANLMGEGLRRTLDARLVNRAVLPT